MEQLFIRCETCHARLRVRDEQFVGQVQACPKCGSMVLIAAPAVPETPPVEVAAEATSSIGSRLAASVHQHTVALAVGGGTLVALVGAIGVYALRGDAEIAAVPSEIPAAATAPTLEAPPPIAAVQQDEAADVLPTVKPIHQRAARPAEATVDAPPAVDPPATAMPKTQPERTAQVAKVESPPARTLTLEPVEAPPASAAPLAASSYSPVAETPDDNGDETVPPSATPARLTNVKDQLSVPLESIELPETTITEFVQLISEMAAVPIALDPAVPKRIQVTVQARDITLGMLLSDVLREHGLTSEERDGRLVIVKAKRN